MAQQTVSPADRIRELSAINADVAAMLTSAGLAINALTSRPLERACDKDGDIKLDSEHEDNSIEQRKVVFEKNTKAYYEGLQGIIARLRRQAYALEEAGIIAPENQNMSSSTQPRQASQIGGSSRGQPLPGGGQERITNGGLGNLDVGWLNSRGNKVGAEKENELLEEAKKLIEETLSRSPSTAGG